jgi:hypothetical protein
MNGKPGNSPIGPPLVLRSGYERRGCPQAVSRESSLLPEINNNNNNNNSNNNNKVTQQFFLSRELRVNSVNLLIRVIVARKTETV